MTFLLLCAGFVVTAYASTVLLYTAFGRPPVGYYKTVNEGGGIHLVIQPEYESALRELDAEFPAALALPEAPKDHYSNLRAFVSSRSLPGEGGAPVRMDTLETLVDGEWVRKEVLRFDR